MNIKKAFEVAFNRKRQKNWEKIYVIVDIHDTVLRACYEQQETYDYFPHARKALQMLTQRPDICLILWSACDESKLSTYLAHFAQDGIVFDYANCNPEVGSTELSCFDDKLYFNVGFDDKFGFEGESDWMRVIEALNEDAEPAASPLMGLEHTSQLTVQPNVTAIAMGSGDLPVLATPAMLALMENAAMLAVSNHLPVGTTTVGAHIDVSHMRPTAIDGAVTATAVVTAVAGKKITFAVSARCGDTLLGQGTHVRYIVNREQFMQRL